MPQVQDPPRSGRAPAPAALLALAALDFEGELYNAEQALSQGVSPAAVNSLIKDRSKGFLSDVQELRNWVAGQKRGRELTTPPPGAAQGQEKRAAQERIFSTSMQARSEGRDPSFLEKLKETAGIVAPMAAHGATFGLAPDIVGMVSPEAEEKYRSFVGDVRTAAPVAAGLAELGGGLPLGVLGAGKVAAPIVARTGSRAVGAAGAGAAGGATIGAAYGFGESPEDRVGGTLRGGAMGAGVGAAFGVAPPLIGREAERWMPSSVRNMMGTLGKVDPYAQRTMGARPPLQTARAGAAPTTAGAPAAQLSAQRNLARILQEGDISPADLPRQVQQIGPQATVVDLGPGVARETRAAISQAPRLSRQGGPVSQIEQRGAERGTRLTEAVQDAGMVPPGVTRKMFEDAAEIDLQTVRRTIYQPLEDQFQSVTSPRITEAIRSPAIRKHLPEAVTGKNPRPPSFTELQEAMWQVDDDITELVANRRPNTARTLRGTLEEFKGAMNDELPGFHRAQTRYAIAHANREAYEAGIKAMRGSKPVHEVEEQIRKLSPGAAERFRYGMIDHLETTLGERVGGGAAANRLTMAGDTMLRRLRLLAAGDDEFGQLLGVLEREGIYQRTLAGLRGNSTTAQQASDIGFQIVNVPRDTVGWIMKAINSIGGITPAERRQAANILGEVLMGSGEEAAELLAAQLTVASERAGGVASVLAEQAQRRVPGPRG